MRKIIKPLILLSIGGVIYTMMELLWRGHTHPAMIVVGGLCFLCVGAINEVFSWEMPLVWQGCIGGLIITVIEFISGCILNLWLGLEVWSYANMPLNLLGQICPAFSLLWWLLSICVAIPLDDFLRYHLFGERAPHYKLI